MLKTATKEPAGLSAKPQAVDERTWYYEEPRGVLVIHQVFNEMGVYMLTRQFLIPWGVLRLSLSRKDHSLAARRKRDATAKRSVGKNKPSKSK